MAQTTGPLGTLTYQAAYNAFGQHQPDHHVVANGPYTFIAPGTQEWTASGAKTDRLRASTKEEDPDGLVYYGQRYLRPELGMFASVDPAGDIDGPNRWVLCRQNPWSGFDAEGLALALPQKREITDKMSAEQRIAAISHNKDVDDFNIKLTQLKSTPSGTAMVNYLQGRQEVISISLASGADNKDPNRSYESSLNGSAPPALVFISVDKLFPVGDVLIKLQDLGYELYFQDRDLVIERKNEPTSQP